MFIPLRIYEQEFQPLMAFYKDGEINKLTAQIQRLTEHVELLRMQPAPTRDSDKKDIDKI
jgi:hypothetical protein